MERQVGLEKDNAATRAANMVKQMNMDRGAPAGRTSGAPVAPVSTIRVSSAAMLGDPVFLDPKDQTELDQKARELGILPPIEGEETNPYPSLEEAQEAGLPEKKEPVMSAREFLGETFRGLDRQFKVDEKPRLIDFKRVQGIDLIRGVAFVDGFEIALTPEHVHSYKTDIIELAVDYVTKQLAEAIAELTPPKVEPTPEVINEGKEPIEEPKTEEV